MRARRKLSAAATASVDIPTTQWRQIALRLPQDLLDRIDALAAADISVVRSRNGLIVEALTHAVEHPSPWIGAAEDLRQTRWDRHPVDRSKPKA